MYEIECRILSPEECSDIEIEEVESIEEYDENEFVDSIYQIIRDIYGNM